MVAYELLVVKAKDSKEKLRPWSNALSNGGVGLEEFADQCSVLVEGIEGTSKYFQGIGTRKSSTKSDGNNRKSLVSRSRNVDEDDDE